VSAHAGEHPELVLVVEDDRDVRDSVIEVLADHGYGALAAGNGAEGLALLRGTAPKPALVLLDLMMPVMDGRAFRAAQQADPRLQAIPVVILSAHAAAERAAIELGAAGFLQKPVSLEALLATVRRFCPSPPS
jgi:CheY-like chemotaxis protein